MGSQFVAARVPVWVSRVVSSEGIFGEEIVSEIEIIDVIGSKKVAKFLIRVVFFLRRKGDGDAGLDKINVFFKLNAGGNEDYKQLLLVLVR